jgi:hypothetical protein
MEKLWQECKTYNDGCREKGLLIMKAETISSGKFNQIQGMMWKESAEIFEVLLG